MRLTCPNCSARYEVDESMIPVGGRDVQCSNCSTTWFQPGPRPPEVEPDFEPEAAPETTDAPTPEVARSLSEVFVETPAAAEGEPAGQRPSRRQIDPGVADILREEADREARLRRAEAQPEPVETQEEMPLESAEGAARNRRLAELDAIAEDAFDTDGIVAAVATATAGSRRELLPDIEEINSTLRATDDRSAAEADATDYDTLDSVPRRRGQVRRGFFLAILIALIGTGIYAYSGQIAAVVPQVGPVLERYVQIVDQGRFWLDDLARSVAQGNDG